MSERNQIEYKNETKQKKRVIKFKKYKLDWLANKVHKWRFNFI